MNKKIFLFLGILVLLLIPLTSASFEYVEDKDIYIVDTIIPSWLGGKGESTIKLLSNTDQCLINCEAVLEFNNEQPVSLLEGINIIDKLGNDAVGALDYVDFYYGIDLVEEKTRDVFDSHCSEKDEDGYMDCNHTIIGQETYYKNKTVWNEYRGEEFDGKVYLKIVAKKDIKKEVDWIIEFRGKELSEWAWWDTDWKKKKIINVTENSAINLNNFSVKLNVTYDSDMQSDFEDLRFLDSTESTEIGYWIEEKVHSNYAIVWVFLDQLNAGSTETIYMYYNNPSANDASNITATFIYGNDGSRDDFSDNFVGSCTASVVSNKLRFSFGTSTACDYSFPSPYTATDINWTLEFKGNRTNPSTGNVASLTLGGSSPSDYRDKTSHDFYDHVNQKFSSWEGAGQQLWGFYDRAFNNFTLTVDLSVISTTEGVYMDVDQQNGTVWTRENAGGRGGGAWNDIAQIRAMGGTGFFEAYDVRFRPSVLNEPTGVFGAEESLLGTNIDPIYPENGDQLTNSFINFTYNITASGTNFVNSTLYVYNATDDSIVFTNFTSLSGNTSQILNISNNFINGEYKWSADIYDDNSDRAITSNRSFSIDLDPPKIIITAPIGTQDFIRIGSNETLNYSITDASLLDQCWFEYNNTEQIVNSSYTPPGLYSIWDFTTNYANVTKVKFGQVSVFELDNIPANCSRRGNFSLLTQVSGLNTNAYCYNQTNGIVLIDTVINSADVTFANITAMQKRPLDCSGNTTEFEYVVNKNTLCVHAIDELGLHTQNDTEWDYLFVEIEDNFESEVYETELNTFTVGYTVPDNTINIEGILNYNGTRYTSLSSCTGNVCNSTTSINAPLINAASENFTFQWELTIFLPTSSDTILFDEKNQTVNEIKFEECGTLKNETLLFTAFDENNLSSVNNFNFDANFNYWIGNGGVKKQYNITKTGVDNVSICLEPTGNNFNIDADISYGLSNDNIYRTRSWHYLNHQVNDTRQNIELGLLDVNFDTSFIEKVQDANLLSVPEVLIETQRYYPGLDSYKTVQIGKTDKVGQTVGFFNTETVDYRFIVRDSTGIQLTTDKSKVIGTTTPFTLIFTIGSEIPVAWNSYKEIEDFSSSLNISKESKLVTYTYLDDSGNFNESRLYVYEINRTGDNILICNELGTESSQALSCNLTSYTKASFQVITTLKRTGSYSQIIDQTQFSIGGLGIDPNFGLFLGLLILLICAFAFKFNEIAGIILLNVGIIANQLIGFIDFGWIAIGGIMGVSILIIGALER